MFSLLFILLHHLLIIIAVITTCKNNSKKRERKKDGRRVGLLTDLLLRMDRKTSLGAPSLPLANLYSVYFFQRLTLKMVHILKPFYYQLMHIMLKNTELLKHSKITLQQYTFTQCTTHTPYRSQYAAIALTTPCTAFMQIRLTKCVIFSQALTVAP